VTSLQNLLETVINLFQKFCIGTQMGESELSLVKLNLQADREFCHFFAVPS